MGRMTDEEVKAMLDRIIGGTLTSLAASDVVLVISVFREIQAELPGVGDQATAILTQAVITALATEIS